MVRRLIGGQKGPETPAPFIIVYRVVFRSEGSTQPHADFIYFRSTITEAHFLMPVICTKQKIIRNIPIEANYI